jgi:uncharacterized protein YgfB (UPF0149 family)
MIIFTDKMKEIVSVEVKKDFDRFYHNDEDLKKAVVDWCWDYLYGEKLMSSLTDKKSNEVYNLVFDYANQIIKKVINDENFINYDDDEDEYDTKEEIIDSIKQAMIEIKQIENGEIEAKPIRDFIQELDDDDDEKETN